ncbi:J domain-containing protein required for chloroplast accumulation response 1 isoform X2 [Macadamia integrifolia]|uniref:J domain-containing protein required for chloroplast accumulation response 1 isoform X2 n=1 Tax=Macadamia integrifolia TaxID=60698 RepID=UPI001C4E957F|nr:J domain-containing protein required for chloroplast accumulation response 1 isoform X2 [Macadamia integrifolia]
MERFSYKDHILVGLEYGSQWRSVGNPSSSPKTPSRNSDVDFSDVFGGPPRRSSVHEFRRSDGDTLDSYAYGEERGEGEEALASCSSWSFLSEKPVFGEEGLVRRRYPSHDFFNDIFRGDESSSSTSRKPDWDSFSSTPASRIQSPVRPLASKLETLGPSSLPTQLSLPPKLAKGMDFLEYNTSTSGNSYRNKDGASNAGFPSLPEAFISRASNQVIHGQDDLKNDARLSYRQSPLSHEFSLYNEESSKASRFGNKDRRGHLKKETSSPEMHEEQFHFSIYKWASKGVPLVMPFKGGNRSSSKDRGNDSSSSSSREKSKSEIVESELSVEFPSLNDRISSVNSSFHMEYGKQGSISVLNTVTKDRTDSVRSTEKAAYPKPDRDLFQSINTEVPHSFTMQKEGKETNHFTGVSGSSPDKGLHGGIKREAHISMQEKGKSEPKSLHSLFHNIYDGQEKDGMVRQAEGKEDKEGTVKTVDVSSGNIGGDRRFEKQDNRNMFDLAANSGLQGTRENSRDKVGGNKVKGKVKEFVKIFNQEAPPKHMTNVVTQGHSSGGKEKGASKADDGARICASKADGKENMTNVKSNKTSTNGHAMVDRTLKQPEKSHFVNTTYKSKDIFSGRTDNSASRSETIPASFEAPLWSVEEFHREDIQGSYLVEEPSPNQNRQQEVVENHEEIQISDARIRQWSNGKEANIRALLSTLQYVLWPESGWKPVPLVNIIEGSSVKRAYQKALLCLHPDKLQQKGAATQQKYIAEKVFDILQEAWTHFNSQNSF